MELQKPLGMSGMHPGFDGSGTFVGSSYLTSSALDLARIGLLYLRDGVWDGRRILPEGWHKGDGFREPVRRLYKSM